MKKFISTTLLFWLSSNLTACSFIENKEEKFVNPLFYEKLISISNYTYDTLLTPKNIKMDGYNSISKATYDCKLTENTFEQIMFECTRYIASEKKHIQEHFVFRIKSCKDVPTCFDKEGWIVYQISSSEAPHNDATYIIPSKIDFGTKTFANPLFYETLSPISQKENTTLLTPTSIKLFDENKIYPHYHYEKCKLVENNPMFITMECEGHNNFLKQTQKETLRYSIQYCSNDYCYGGNWYVYLKKDGSRSTYIID